MVEVGLISKGTEISSVYPGADFNQSVFYELTKGENGVKKMGSATFFKKRENGVKKMVAVPFYLQNI
ncbi:MAG: hypothetical protein ACQESF_06835, partial [Nanobdellota archaeon]